MTARLILVDEANAQIGLASWEDAHTFPEGRLHRAFSVYIFRNNGAEILVQRRSQSKLFAGLWANACCSHPREGEEIVEVAPRRLKEELGFTCPLTILSAFVYQATDPEGKGAEHEHVTAFRGDTDGHVTVNADSNEVAEWKWVGIKELHEAMKKRPDRYAPWFHVGMKKLIDFKL